MSYTNDGELRMALARLHWALQFPLPSPEEDWDGRLSRALAALRDAWDGHAASAETAIAQAVDPSLLPFTPLSQRAGELFQDHVRLHAEIGALDTELSETAAAYRSLLSSESSDGSPPPLDPGRVMCRLRTIPKRARQLIGELDEHLSVESDLLLTEPNGAAFPTG
jgi:hypothetical protein